MKKYIITIIAIFCAMVVFAQNTTTYQYDKKNRLINSENTNTAKQYGFDELGNRTQYVISSQVAELPDLQVQNIGLSSTTLEQGTTIKISSNNEYIKVLMESMPAPYRVTLKIPISLNTANQEELDAIPNIGPSLAKKIINYRSISGPFKTVDEIKCIPTVGKIRYNKIRPYIGI